MNSEIKVNHKSKHRMESQIVKQLVERRNPNLLNNREGLQAEPVAAQMKPQ